jgi:hypothetical protein
MALVPVDYHATITYFTYLSSNILLQDDYQDLFTLITMQLITRFYYSPHYAVICKRYQSTHRSYDRLTCCTQGLLPWSGSNLLRG